MHRDMMRITIRFGRNGRVVGVIVLQRGKGLMLKRLILSSLLLVGVFGGAYAYEKCIAIAQFNLQGAATGYTAPDYAVDWTVNWRHSSGNITDIKGISSCATTTYSVPSTATSLNGLQASIIKLTHASGGGNKTCYCRIISPIHSTWRQLGASTYFTTETDCMQKCAYQCANTYRTTNTFRASFFQTNKAFYYAQ